MVFLWGALRPHAPNSSLKIDGPPQRIARGGEEVKDRDGSDDNREHGVAEIVAHAAPGTTPERPPTREANDAKDDHHPPVPAHEDTGADI